MFKGPLAGALNNGTIGERIAEGNSEFDDARARLDRGEDDFSRGGEIGIAAGDVSDEGGFVFEVERHGSIVDGGELRETQAGS